MDRVASFEIRSTSYLDPRGQACRAFPAFAQSSDELIRLYRGMVLARAFDTKAIALQRTGMLATYASSLGQEAVSVGVASAMAANDVLLPSFREHGAQLWRGVTLLELFLFWGGDERGHDYAIPRRDFPVSIPVGSHAPHAAGVALAMKLRDEPRAAVCVLGDGATSKGDFYEALNAAGVWKLPVVFVVTNNQWAISTPRSSQTAAETLAQKAIAAGMSGEQVDGNDVIAVRQATAHAVERGRQGIGPTLIEALTYRVSDHTTADDARRYRSDETVSRQWGFEPIGRLRAYLASAAAWTKDDEDRLLTDCRSLVETAASEYLAMPPARPEAIFDSLYAVLPENLARQRDEALMGESFDA
jgi:pyruvate dehydrogenase E1 component alpha subunit